MTQERDPHADLKQVLVDHVSDGSGWCVACGERLPCMYVKDATSLLILAGEMEPPPNAWPGGKR